MNRFVLALLLAIVLVKINAESSDIDAVANELPRNRKETVTGSQAARDELLDDLLATYKTYSYPDNSTVRIGLTLFDVNLDVVKNEMHVSTWVRYSWTDRRLVWDQEERGVEILRIPSSKVWFPDVTLYNSANQNQRMSCWDSNVVVYPTGKVVSISPCHLQTFCNLTLSQTPLSEQVCILKFGSWTFDSLTVGLDFWEDEKLADASNYLGSGEFEITTNKAQRNEKKYDCCEEPYFDLTYTLGLTKIDYTDNKCETKN